MQQGRVVPLSQSAPDEPRAVYIQPTLRELGELSALTLGGSVGRGDSGAPTQQAIPGGP